MVVVNTLYIDMIEQFPVLGKKREEYVPQVAPFMPSSAALQSGACIPSDLLSRE